MNRRIKKKKNKFVEYQSNMDKIHTEKNILTFGMIKNFFDGCSFNLILNIYSGENNQEPHIHLDCKENEFHSCISLISPHYYIQNKECDLLSETQKELLNEYLDKLSYNKVQSIWEIACMFWEMNVPLSKSALNHQKPDYTQINSVLINV